MIIESLPLLDLKGFEGGYVTALGMSEDGPLSAQIFAKGPGSIRITDYLGPKDWSPRKRIPKDWQFMLKIPADLHVSMDVRYTNVYVLDRSKPALSTGLHCDINNAPQPRALYFAGWIV